jgi:hypothetical protein
MCPLDEIVALQSIRAGRRASRYSDSTPEWRDCPHMEGVDRPVRCINTWSRGLSAKTVRSDRLEPDADALGSETVWQLAAQGSTCHCEATAKLLLRPLSPLPMVFLGWWRG